MANGAVVLTINGKQTAQEISDFLNTNGYAVPVLLDTNKSMATQYGVTGTPTTFFIDRSGVIRYIQVGEFSGTDEIQQDLDTIT